MVLEEIYQLSYFILRTQSQTIEKPEEYDEECQIYKENYEIMCNAIKNEDLDLCEEMKPMLSSVNNVRFEHENTLGKHCLVEVGTIMAFNTGQITKENCNLINDSKIYICNALIEKDNSICNNETFYSDEFNKAICNVMITQDKKYCDEIKNFECINIANPIAETFS